MASSSKWAPYMLVLFSFVSIMMMNMIMKMNKMAIMMITIITTGMMKISGR